MPRVTNEMVMDWYHDYVTNFQGELAKGTSREWTPFRFCSEDWLLAVCVVRSTRTKYEVALFGCEEHCDFEPDAGLKAALSFMLADAFHRTGQMEIQFRGPRHGEAASRESGYCHSIPGFLRAFAESMGVILPKGRVIPHELGEALYQRMVGLDSGLAELLRKSGIDPTRCAFLLHRGTVAAEILELVARYSGDPRVVLEGRLVPESWLAFKRELLLLRRGILAERTRILFELGSKEERERAQVNWVTSSTIEIGTSSGFQLQTINEEIVHIPSTDKATVILCPLDQTELAKFDLASLHSENPMTHRFIVVPRDFKWLSSELQESWITKAGAQGVSVLCIYESLDELDSELLVKIERLATTRMMIEEQKE